MGDNHHVAHAEDAELVRCSRRGDRMAFGELVRRYRRAAYAVALAVTRVHEDAEDAAQEAFLVALDRLEDCRDPERFSAWLLTIVRNRSRNLIRREQLREGEAMPFSVESPDPGPVLRLERSELRRTLMDAVGRLPGVQREVLLLHDLEGWKHREIAARLGIPAGTVRSHLHYARKRLRRTLSGQAQHLVEQSAG